MYRGFPGPDARTRMSNHIVNGCPEGSGHFVSVWPLSDRPGVFVMDEDRARPRVPLGPRGTDASRFRRRPPGPRTVRTRVAPMLDARLDLSQAPIKIPERFHHVHYDHDRYPGVPGIRGLVVGANCQQYGNEFLRAFGYRIPNFRSSDLWADTVHTVVSTRPGPFDLVLVHDKPIPGVHMWGSI